MSVVVGFGVSRYLLPVWRWCWGVCSFGGLIITSLVMLVMTILAVVLIVLLVSYVLGIASLLGELGTVWGVLFSRVVLGRLSRLTISVNRLWVCFISGVLFSRTRHF